MKYSNNQISATLIAMSLALGPIAEHFAMTAGTLFASN